jgi:choice-of-anchor C domain-containing protein
MNKFNALLIAATAVVAAAGSASAVTLVNGSFELGTDPGAGFTSEAAGSSAITGWTVGGFGVDYIGGYWMASDGVRSIDLSGTSSGSLSQTFATTVGTDYTVTFDLSGNPDGGTGTKLALTTISGSLPQLSTYTVTAANSRANMNWQTYSYTFTAFAAQSTLTFASFEYSPYGPALDNVSVLETDGSGATVPEPATWALMIGGFGLVGATARRRRQAANSVTA